MRDNGKTFDNSQNTLSRPPTADEQMMLKAFVSAATNDMLRITLATERAAIRMRFRFYDFRKRVRSGRIQVFGNERMALEECIIRLEGNVMIVLREGVSEGLAAVAEALGLGQDTIADSPEQALEVLKAVAKDEPVSDGMPSAASLMSKLSGLVKEDVIEKPEATKNPYYTREG